MNYRKRPSKEERAQRVSELVDKIEACATEDELEQVSDIIDDTFMAGLICKKDYKYLETMQDDQIGYLVEMGAI